MNMYVHGENGPTFVGPMIYGLCDWRALVRSKTIQPSDGCGYWIVNGKAGSKSAFDPMPENATGVEWHNL